MPQDQYFRYLDLPRLPTSLLDAINWNMSEYTRRAESQVPDQFLWTDDHNQLLDQWAKAHIGSDLYFAFQLMSADVPIHKDRGSKLKLNYVLDTGGDQVITQWYADDQSTLLQEAVIQPMAWHLFRADIYHSVHNIGVGRTRFAVTARIFP